MEEEWRKRGDACPKLLDLIPKERDWMVRDSGGEGQNEFVLKEEKKLKLKLGPPRGEDWQRVERKIEEPTLLSLRFIPHASKTPKGGFSETYKPNNEGFNRKVGCPSPSHVADSVIAAAANSLQTRTGSVPVVGWPPIRSFRKNLASSSLKLLPVAPDQNGESETGTKSEICRKGWFVKINMDGIPIGRKVDLKAYDSYKKLTYAVEELFHGLLSVQKNPAATTAQLISAEQRQAFKGLLDGNGAYTLVYEDNEGDTMLVGDIPWEMFVSTAKRLWVVKSSELSTHSLGSVMRKRTATEC